ncbi:MAG: DUF3365 domain-containing protein [Planctomycetota bacterium]|nr:DUF3365 domain-containing protein [Planctomycetota bacterium]MDA1177335.1 DUF3365 domain-containing protein [Planctomycetota bacterium]
MNMPRKQIGKLAFLAAVIIGGLGATPAEDPALERTRKQIRMLDDIYKGGVVLITTHYVNEKSDLPAGTAFKKLFAAAKEKGWHEVRLLDATGQPYNDENAAQDDFEREAIKKLTQGNAWHEERITRDGKPFLRVATPIPVVMEKCIMCHDNYKDVAQGQAVGALGYIVPIE